MADKIYRVNMTDLSTTIEDVPESWVGLGGRGLTSTIVAQPRRLYQPATRWARTTSSFLPPGC